MSRNDTPFISVILPSFNGASTIIYTLCSLLAQRYPRDRFEVIVVDDGSSDRTKEIVSLLRDEFNPRGFSIALLANEGRGAAAARNLAVRSARGEIVAMTDQDVFLAVDWLAKIALNMAREKVAGLYGKMLTDFKNFVEPLNSTAINAKYLTASSAYRRDVLLEVGIFSPEFPFFRGDSDLAYKIFRRGLSIVYAEDVLAFHPLRRFRWGQLKGMLRWSLYDPLLFKKYPRYASEDTLRQVVPRFTPEGLAFTSFIALVVAASLISPMFGLFTAVALLGCSVVALSFARSTLRGRPASIRLKASVLSLIVYLFIVCGRIAGSAKYRSFII